MKVFLYTAPVLEPITLDDLKLHLRIDLNNEDENDEYLEMLIKMAREHVEAILKRALITQVWDYWMDAFPTENYFELPFGKLQSVTSLAYTDSANTTTTMVVTTEYLVDIYSEPGRVVLPYGKSWPSPSTYYPVNPIKCRYTCGYGLTPSTVPASIRAAIKLVAAHFYENRELVTSGNVSVGEIPYTINNLLMPHRLWKF